MLTQTTETAIQCLAYLARSPAGTMITPLKISTILETSTSYTSKILRILAKAGLLTSHRGVSGGFTLDKKPNNISLLQVYEACQGVVVGNYCREMEGKDFIKACGYHKAMSELKDSFTEVLTRWTIADIARIPSPDLETSPTCKSRWTHQVDDSPRL